MATVDMREFRSPAYGKISAAAIDPSILSVHHSFEEGRDEQLGH
jgi:hypothetical protein